MKDFITSDLAEIKQFYENYDLEDIRVRPDFDLLIKMENLKDRLVQINKGTEGEKFLEKQCKEKIIELKHLVFPNTYELYKKYKSQVGNINECNFNKKVKANCNIGLIMCEFPTNPCSNEDIELMEKTKYNVPKIIMTCD